MLFVLKKDKIVSYLVTLGIIIMLFAVGNVVPNSIKNNTLEVAATTNKKLPIYSVKTEDKKVALTINCAWNADDIDLILETLQKENVKVTFFMVGTWVDKYGEAVKKIAEAGHEIGNHSDTHPHVNNLSKEKNIEQIQRCSEKIKKITGNGTSLYRGPYGEYNDVVIEAAEEAGHKTIQWSIDTLDYNSLTGEQMLNRINSKLTNGSIILMHSGTENTALSLEMIIQNIKEKGYEIVPVSELIFDDNYTIDSTGMQYKT